MAPEMSYEPRAYNDPSSLSLGWHPAFLLAITDEATPDGWMMHATSPRMWRWWFAVWSEPTLIAQVAPERQSAVSSQKFTPKGRQPASKAYLWTCALLRKQIQPGERVNLDPLMPLPCRVKIERKEQYANIIDVEPWPEGQTLVTPDLTAKLLALVTPPEEPPATHPVPAQTPPRPPVPQPAVQGWGGTVAPSASPSPGSKLAW